jgi:hypothetical protein
MWEHCTFDRKSRVQILAQRPAILTKDFNIFAQSLQADDRIIPQFSHDYFLPHPLQFIIH